MADDRGWIFQFHPKERYPLFYKQDGIFVEENAVYYYPPANTTGAPEDNELIPVYSDPCYDSTLVNEFTLSPGMRIVSCLSWKAHDSDVTFLKLKKERVWIPMSDKLEKQENPY